MTFANCRCVSNLPFDVYVTCPVNTPDNYLYTCSKVLWCGGISLFDALPNWNSYKWQQQSYPGGASTVCVLTPCISRHFSTSFIEGIFVSSVELMYGDSLCSFSKLCLSEYVIHHLLIPIQNVVCSLSCQDDLIVW